MLKYPKKGSNNGAAIRLPLRSDFAAGHLFFSRRIELPTGLEKGEVSGVVELELEQMSPFPLEHLNYGYRIDEEQKFALVYAAYRKRFESDRVKPWAKLDIVVPEFAIALTKDVADRDSPLALLSEYSVLLLKFDKLSSLPASIESYDRSSFTPSNDSDEEGDDNKAIEAFLREKCEKKTFRIWDVDTEILESNGKVFFRATDRKNGDLVTRVMTRDWTWPIDIRDQATVHRVQAEDKRNILLWRAVLLCCGLFCLLLLGELLFGAASGYLAMRNKSNQAQAPQVFQIGAMRTTISELATFKEADMDPMRLLGTLNPLRDPSTIYSKITTEGPYTLILEVDALNVAKMNDFKRKLEAFHLVESIQESNADTSNKGASATLQVNFFPNYQDLLAQGGNPS